jgi:DNA-binding beta-propeller fold protein YncE
VGAISSSADLHAGTSGAEVFKAALRGPRPPLKFTGPHGVAVRHGRLLAVADASGGAVHLIDLQDRTHRMVRGWEDQRLASPLGVVWVGHRLFVTDAERREVIEFDARGTYVRRFGGDVLVRPVGIAYVASRDQLYVVDGGSHCLRVFELSGSVVATIGERGTREGLFNFPSHLCASPGPLSEPGRPRPGPQFLAVADSGNFRVQLLDLDGRCLGVIGRKGDGAGDFSLPKGVAFDSEGHLYVVDAQFENIQVFDASGRLLLAFGEEGGGVGGFWLPAGLAIDEADRIWVADSGNRRVCVFDYLKASRIAD